MMTVHCFDARSSLPPVPNPLLQLHYFQITGGELSAFRVSFSDAVNKHTTSLTLRTERGAANHAKMLETDQAWNYHEDLVEFYFTQREAIDLPVSRPAIGL
ncbi:ORF6N domain-containing protein [Salmonella enterica]|nr:ORF6N domain-containing protein [Salmonella enterica]